MIKPLDILETFQAVNKIVRNTCSLILILGSTSFWATGIKGVENTTNYQNGNRPYNSWSHHWIFLKLSKTLNNIDMHMNPIPLALENLWCLEKKLYIRGTMHALLVIRTILKSCDEQVWEYKLFSFYMKNFIRTSY